MLKALTIPSFRWLWTGQLLSQFGSAVFLVMGLWEIQLKDPFLLSVAGLAMMLPQLVAAFGGVVVDRGDARKIMLLTDLVRGVAVLLGIMLLLVSPDWRPWIIISLLGINSLGTAFFGPAEGVILPTLVPNQDLPSANGLYSLTYQLSSAVGSGIGGAAIATVGVTLVFGFDLGSFWFSALAILLMMRLTGGRRVNKSPSAISQARAGLGFREGWRALQGFPWFIALLPIVVLTNFTFGGAFILLPYWVHHHLLASATWYGLTSGGWAAGTVVGSLSTGWFSRFSVGKTVGVLGLVQAAMMGVFSMTHAAPVSAGALLVAGAGNGVINALMYTILQRAIPVEVRGRAFGVLVTVLGAANPLAALLAGLSLGVVPMVWWYIAAAITGASLGAALWLFVPKDLVSRAASTAGV